MNPFFVNSALIFDHFESMARAHERMFDMIHNRMIREAEPSAFHRNSNSFHNRSNRENRSDPRANSLGSQRGMTSFLENRAEERLSRSLPRRPTSLGSRRQDTLAREGIKPLSSHSDERNDHVRSRGARNYTNQLSNDEQFSSRAHLGQGWYIATNPESGSISFRGLQTLLESTNGFTFLSLYNPGKQGSHPNSFSFQFKLVPKSEYMINIAINYQHTSSFFLLVLDLLQKTVSLYSLTAVPTTFQSLCRNTNALWQDSFTNTSINIVNHRFYPFQVILYPSKLSISLNNIVIYEKEDYESILQEAMDSSDKKTETSKNETSRGLEGYIGMLLFPKQQLYLKDVELKSSSPILSPPSIPSSVTKPSPSVSTKSKREVSSPPNRKDSADPKSKPITDKSEDPLSPQNVLLLPYEDKKQPEVLQTLRQQLLQRHYDPTIIDIILQEVFTESTAITFNDIAGLSEPKRILEEVVLLPFVLPELFTGMCQPWKGVLLFGPAGTGKTLLAKAIANVHHCTFFNCSTATLISKWRGETEKLIKCLFEAARLASPSILFFDEIDALVTSRGQENEHEASRRMKTEILSQIDGLQSLSGGNNNSSNSNSSDRKVPQVCVLATTNCPWDLDTAMLRRLEKRVYIPLPDEESRKQNFELCLKTMKIQFPVSTTKEEEEDEVSSEEYESKRQQLIATLVEKTEGYSGADIVLVCRETAMIPMRKLLANHSMVDIQQKRVKGDLAIPSIVSEDFEEALKKTKPTIASEIVNKYESWNKMYGSSD